MSAMHLLPSTADCRGRANESCGFPGARKGLVTVGGRRGLVTSSPTILAATVLALMFFGSASASFGHGEVHVQIQAITQRLATNSNAQLYLERGELYRLDHDWEAAAGDYARAEQGRVDSTAVNLARAQLLVDKGELASAKATLDQVILAMPNSSAAHIARARVLVRMDQAGLALADFETGLNSASQPESKRFLEWAQALVNLQRKQDALVVLNKRLRLAGYDEQMQSYAIEIELGLGKKDEALARLDSIIDNADRKERWLARRGDLLVTLGRVAEARRSYAEALNAIARLPHVLQRTPHTLTLKMQIDKALTGMAGGLDKAQTAKL
jgi:tetratricopeptide (TPR) repeat protein